MITVYAAVIEDDTGKRHQFDSTESEEDLLDHLNSWVRARWLQELGPVPAEAEETVQVYFEKQPVIVGPGFGHELYRLEPIHLDLPDVAASVQPGTGACRIEVYCNGELVISADSSSDASGDIRAMHATLEFRKHLPPAAPLPIRRIYGMNDPAEIIYRSPRRTLESKESKGGVNAPPTSPCPPPPKAQR